MPRKLDNRLSQRSFVEELPEILGERGLSVRAIALRADVTPSHLQRVLRRSDYKTPSADLCARVARALELPADYWPEYRERIVIERVRADARLRDEVYRRVRTSRVE